MRGDVPRERHGAVPMVRAGVHTATERARDPARQPKPDGTSRDTVGGAPHLDRLSEREHLRPAEIGGPAHRFAVGEFRDPCRDLGGGDGLESEIQG